MTSTVNETAGATGVERRTLLKVVVVAGGAAAGVGAFAGGAEAAPEAAGTGVVGRIERIAGDGLWVRTRDGDYLVTPTAGARMYSGVSGRVETVDAFVVGDRVVAQGAISRNTVAATAIGSVLTPLTATVSAVDGARAHTSAGQIRLEQGRLPDYDHESAKVRAGDALTGLSWQDPRSGERYLILHGSARG
ncbi:hypothetical protein [Dactylosporangium sp. CS-033363]|uniref:hypothetical protein n=1 Tax=Dactylosporangium sp. CS-033363 TaxID=3239935 RepID=UPI003D8DB580